MPAVFSAIMHLRIAASAANSCLWDRCIHMVLLRLSVRQRVRAAIAGEGRPQLVHTVSPHITQGSLLRGHV